MRYVLGVSYDVDLDKRRVCSASPGKRGRGPDSGEYDRALLTEFGLAVAPSSKLSERSG